MSFEVCLIDADGELWTTGPNFQIDVEPIKSGSVTRKSSDPV